MKFLVLGTRGMAGHTIAIYLKEQGHDVTGFDRKKFSYVNSIVGDAFDVNYLKKIIVEGNYDVIINAIGILNQVAEDNKDKAVFLNSYFPHLLAEITRNMKTKIIHMSTDCVFSGKVGNYTERSFKDGESFYDRTKALGELDDGKNITFRNSIVGPDINENGIGLFNWFMKQKGTINGYTRVMWTGMTTLQLAKMMEKASLCDATGLFNMVPKNNISKYDLLKLFNQYFKNNKIKINPNDKIKTDKTLIRTNFTFNELVPDYELMVKEMFYWINKHKYLYPHYNLDLEVL